MDNWEIKTRSKKCSLCETGFAGGDQYHCVLENDENELIRHDYCRHCWENRGHQTAASPDVISHWHSKIKVYLTDPEQDSPIRKNVAENLLRKYIKGAIGASLSLCYVLAAMLPPQQYKSPSGKMRSGALAPLL